MATPRKLAVVTGSTSGFGLAAASQLLALGVDVVLACRNVATATEVAATLAARHKGPGAGTPAVLALDLADLASVVEFATAFERLYGGRKVNFLLLNAGVMNFGGRAVTKQGYEATVGTNHLGHAALVNLLLPHLKRSATRVVSVASHLHKDGLVAVGTPLDAADGGMPAYANSKLQNVCWSAELQRRFGDTGITAVSLEPGVGLFTNLGPRALWVTVLRATLIPLLIPCLWPSGLYQTKAGGGAVEVAAAFAADAGGKYFHLHREMPPFPLARDPVLRAYVWDETQRLLAASAAKHGLPAAIAVGVDQ